MKVMVVTLRVLVTGTLKVIMKVMFYLLSQKVDQRKLDKAEAKLKEKKEKRINTDKKESQPPIILEMATASQVSVCGAGDTDRTSVCCWPTSGTDLSHIADWHLIES